MDTQDIPHIFSRLLTKDFWTEKLTAANIVRGVLVVALFLGLRYIGALFGSLLGIFLIFWNVGERRSGPSAYSVFNRGANHLLGDLRLARIDRQLRNAGDADEEEDDGHLVQHNAPMEIRSRDANKKCPCGSDKKLKKCCGF